MLFKEIVDGCTDVRTDDGQWAITKAHLEHFVLRWAKKEIIILSLDSKFCFKVQFITDIVKLSEHWLPWQLPLTLTPPTKADESLASSIWSNTLGYRSRAVAVPLPENIGATAASCRAASLVRKTEMKTVFVHTLFSDNPLFLYIVKQTLSSGELKMYWTFIMKCMYP